MTENRKYVNKCVISKQSRVNKREIYKSLYLGKFQYPNNNSSVNIYQNSRSIHPNHVCICIGWRSSSGLIPFPVRKRVESTCCDMKTDTLEGNANDRPNFDVT